MKRNVILVIVLCAATAALSQGVVTFNNNVLTSPPDRLVRCIEDGQPLTGTNWFAQLYYGTTADSLIPVTAAPARFRVATTALPGTWSGGTRTLDGAGGVGTTLFMQVRVWDSNFGSTFDQARASGGGSGQSEVFLYQQLLSAPASPTDTQMVNFQGFSFSCIPEPSVLALGVPTLLAILLFSKGGRR